MKDRTIVDQGTYQELNSRQAITECILADDGGIEDDEEIIDETVGKHENNNEQRKEQLRKQRIAKRLRRMDSVGMIVGNNGAINMKTRELRTLKSLIGKASYNLQTPKNLTFNKQGTLNGPSGSGPDPDIKGDNLTCTPITYPDGSDIGPTEAASLPWVGNKATDSANKAYSKASPYIWLIIAFLGVMILMAGFGYGFSLFSKRKAAKAAAAAAAAGGSGD